MIPGLPSYVQCIMSWQNKELPLGSFQISMVPIDTCSVMSAYAQVGWAYCREIWFEEYKHLHYSIIEYVGQTWICESWIYSDYKWKKEMYTFI